MNSSHNIYEPKSFARGRTYCRCHHPVVYKISGCVRSSVIPIVTTQICRYCCTHYKGNINLLPPVNEVWNKVGQTPPPEVEKQVVHIPLESFLVLFNGEQLIVVELIFQHLFYGKDCNNYLNLKSIKFILLSNESI